VATKAADNGERAAAVEKNGFCVISILMSKKEAICPDGRIVPAAFRVSGFYCNSLIFLHFVMVNTPYQASSIQNVGRSKIKENLSEYRRSKIKENLSEYIHSVSLPPCGHTYYFPFYFTHT
jgi:hypothetical protein